MTRPGSQPWPSGPGDDRPVPLGQALPRLGPAAAASWLAPPPPPPPPTARGAAGDPPVDASAAPAPAPAPARLDPAELDALREQGRAEGRAAGLAETAAARRQAATLRAAAEAALHPVHHADAQPIVELALGGPTGLAGSALALDPAAAVAAARAALTTADASAGAHLWVHPSQVELVSAELPGGIPVEGDPLLAPGECRAETRRRIVDASLTARVAALRAPLLALVDQARAAAEAAAAAASAAEPAPTPPADLQPAPPPEAAATEGDAESDALASAALAEAARTDDSDAVSGDARVDELLLASVDEEPAS